MYCSNGSSSMATLLQQKNCMKTLTNGGVASGTTASSSGSGGSQQTRVALPHELAGITQMATTVAGTSSNVTGNVGGDLSGSASALRHPHHLNSHHAIHQQQQQHQQYHNNYGYYNNVHSHHNDTASNTMYHRQALTAASSSTTSTSTQHSNHPHLPHLHHAASAAGTVPFNQRSMPADSTTELDNVGGGDTHNGLNRVRGGSDGGDGVDGTTATSESPTATTANNEQPMEEEQEAEPEIDIVINNVVCSFSVRCHLNLREIALNGINVEFRRENGMVTMKLRRPYTTASIWSSGRITCTGATSEDQAKIAARRYARCLQKLGFSVKFNHFRVVNVLGTCSMPWAIKIVNFSEKYKQDASYEPELHPGVTYKLKVPKATLKIFSTGSITVTASSVANVQAAIEHIFPLVYEFRKKRAHDDPKLLKERAAAEAAAIKTKHPFGHASNDPLEDTMLLSEQEEDFDEDL